MTTTPQHITKTTPPTHFTCTDIATRFGVTVAAVSNWRRRYGSGSPTPFPAPDDTDPLPAWRTERWPEIDAWDKRRRGQRRGPRTNLRQRTDGQYLLVNDIAERLNVSPVTVRHWRRTPPSKPFPQPAKEITQKTRTIPLWREDQWADIHQWREWHLTHGTGQQRPPRRSPRDDVPQSNTEAALPPSSHFLRVGRSTSRRAVRQGHVVRSSVRRLVR